ncbi:hypothetical protein BG004_000041 [Podila humilis]|nr:hypothetical protein BG004_000041 [Podila humilis]
MALHRQKSAFRSDYSGGSSSTTASRQFGTSSSTLNTPSNSREFGPSTSYRGVYFDQNTNNRSLDYFSGLSSGSGLGLGLGPPRFMDREDWRGRPGQFMRDIDRDRESRGRETREPRPFRDSRERGFFAREMDRDPREGLVSTRDFRERDSRDRGEARDRGGHWNQDLNTRESKKSRDGLEIDVRELVELERERVREKEKERDRARERPIWIRESEREHAQSQPRGSLDSLGRERDRHSMVQELDRDLLAYTSDTTHNALSTRGDGSNHAENSNFNSVDTVKSNNGMQSLQHPRGTDHDKHTSKSHVHSSLGVNEHIHEDEQGFGREQDHDRDHDRHFDHDRSLGRQEAAHPAFGTHHHRIFSEFGQRQRVISAPMTDDPDSTENSGPSRLRDFHTRGSYPSSSNSHNNYCSQIDRPERGQRDKSDTTERFEEVLPVHPKSRRSVDNPEHPSYRRVEKKDVDGASPQDDRDKFSLPNSPGPLRMQPSWVRPNLFMQQNVHIISAPMDQGRTDSTPKPLLQFEQMKSHTQLNDLNGFKTPPSRLEEPSGTNVQMEQENVKTTASTSEAPSLVNEAASCTVQSRVSAGAESNDISSKLVNQKSPSTSSLPSPGLSPVQRKPADPTSDNETMNHADILVSIDVIDGDIQKYERFLRDHRRDKEKFRASPMLTQSIFQETVEVKLKKPDTDLVILQDVVSTINNTTPDSFEHESMVPQTEQESNGSSQTPNEITQGGVIMRSPVAESTTLQEAPIFSLKDIMGPTDTEDPFYQRKTQQTRKPQLFDQIYAENNSRAKKYGRIHLPSHHPGDQDEGHGHSHGLLRFNRQVNNKPRIYLSVHDYPFYQENIDNHSRLRCAMLKNLAVKAAALDEKEFLLKREYKQHWETWNKKIEKLDKQKEKSNTPAPSSTREEDYNVSETAVFTTRNRRGAYTSDAVRSEAELLEIIQSLENADMRNPDVRASRTAATVPPMILDPFVREHVHYYDYNHLIMDPATYYRLGPVTDIWTEGEREIFTKRYLNHPKQFGKIAQGLENKTASQCVLFYYREKKKIGFKDMLSNRGRKRRNNGVKRKEKAIQPPSPPCQPGKKHKGSALIEDIGQASRTKQAKTKELRELQESNQVFKGFDVEPGSRRRVRSSAVSQQGGTPGLDDTSSAPSPVLSSTVSTPIITSAEKRKQRAKGSTRASRNSSAVATGVLAEEGALEDKKLKVERTSPAVVEVVSSKISKQEDQLISVDSPRIAPTVSKVSVAEDGALSDVSAAPMQLEMPISALPVPPGPPVARWTTAEHTRAIEALKKHGRDFEAVAVAVGTKTVDQCRNFCFNYKRKFGVSALDDANSLRSIPSEESDMKESLGVSVEKSKLRKTKTSDVSQSITVNSHIDKDTAVLSSRKRGGRQALTAVSEVETVDEPTMDSSIQQTTEEQDTNVPKSRRKRTTSRSEGAHAEVALSTAGTSFRALYSREPPSATNSPALTGFAPSDSGQFNGQNNVDGVIKRPNFSSYWSRQEKMDFVRLLAQYGKDWDKIARELKSKTQIQVRNHFSNNSEKLIANGVIGMDVVSNMVGDQEELVQAPNTSSPVSTSFNNDQRHSASVYSNNRGKEATQAGAGPRTGYFMPPVVNNVQHDQETVLKRRDMSPPRRVTNIGNLLNNTDEDVHVGVEDWFGNSEEASSQGGAEEDETGEKGLPVASRNSVDNPYHEARPWSSRHPDDDVETEDEIENPPSEPCIRYERLQAYTVVPGPRRVSEGSVIPSLGYSQTTPGALEFHGQRHSQPSQPSQHHPQGTGSPYRQLYYVPPVYSSPLMTATSSPSSQGYQRIFSQSGHISNTPSAIIAKPTHNTHPQQHYLQQRSNSMSHSDFNARSQPSPQLSLRAQSPITHPGPYFGPHHYQPAPAPLSGHFPSHRHAPAHVEVQASPPGETHRMAQHSSLTAPLGHGTPGHNGSGRYSSSPQMRESVINMRGSPVAGNVSPAHGGPGSTSRFSPAPIASPIANDNSLRHAQAPYSHLLRRSSSPFQHLPGHAPSPSYVQGPPVHLPRPSSHSYSSPQNSTSLLPPPLPASAGVPPSSEIHSGPGYHGAHSISQHFPNHGHHPPPLQALSYTEPHLSMPTSSTSMSHHRHAMPGSSAYHPHS